MKWRPPYIYRGLYEAELAREKDCEEYDRAKTQLAEYLGLVAPIRPPMARDEEGFLLERGESLVEAYKPKRPSKWEALWVWLLKIAVTLKGT